MSILRQVLDRLKFRTPAPEQGVVLALGSGGAAGLAHIGVLEVLAENGIAIRAVAGTSIGAEIGAFLAAGKTPAEIADMARKFDWIRTLRLFMPDFPAGGVSSGSHIMKFLRAEIGEHRIEDLAMGYLAVAADVETGKMAIIDRGNLIEAVRASISLPGLMTPQHVGDRYFIDGGVLNPVPFDVARERFGGPVVAVAVHSGVPPMPPLLAADDGEWPRRLRELLGQSWMPKAPQLREWLEQHENNRQKSRKAKTPWSARQILDRAHNVMLNELVALRAQISPPDLLIAPAVADIGLLEFYRADETIALGRRAAEAKLPELKKLAAGS
jgi:NTE family protein